MKIAVDVMGTDYGPKEIILGAVDAVRKFGCQVVLVGAEELIQKILVELKADKNDKITIKNATQVIEMSEHPAIAIRKKRDASIVVASAMLKEGECDALVSPGSTGAAAASALFIVGRIKGIERPAIATAIPGLKGFTCLLDSGANADLRAEHFVANAIMGSVFAERILKAANPRVGLLNIGEEETKGNEMVKEVYPLLKAEKQLNFIGNVEGRDITHGMADVVVCDGFVGNVVLKSCEGIASAIMSLIKESVLKLGFLGKLGGLLLKPAFAEVKRRMDPNTYGGALLLGVRAPFVICHGNSKAYAITNAINVAIEAVKEDMVDIIAEKIAASQQEREITEE